jgi:hypothetical protein
MAILTQNAAFYDKNSSQNWFSRRRMNTYSGHNIGLFPHTLLNKLGTTLQWKVLHTFAPLWKSNPVPSDASQ